MDLHDYLELIRRRLWILLSLPTIAAVTAGLLSYFVLSPTYEASATVWVVKQDLTPPTMSDLTFNRSLVRTYGEIAKGRRVLEQVIIDANLKEEVSALQARVNVNAVDGTEVMKITVADSSAERAAEIANSVANAFSKEIRQFMRLENVRLVEEALPPDAPVRPNKLRSLAIGLGLGAGTAVGLVLLLEALDRSIKSGKDVKRQLQLRLLGTVPPGDGGLVTVLKPESAASEAYRILRANLRYGMKEQPLRTILITSADRDEGKTVTTANLATVLAQTGARVLAVDASLRRPALGVLFGMEQQAAGLSDILQGSHTFAQVVQAGPVPGLSVLPSGPVPANPAELLGSDRLAALLAFARERFDYVLFDSPPAVGESDASVLASQLDGTLLVVQTGVTPYPRAQQARDALLGVGASILGVLLLPGHGAGASHG